MIDKPFYIILAAYSFSFGMLGAQFLADSYGITLTAPDGTPIKNELIVNLQQDQLNQFATNVSSSNNGTSWGLEPIIQAGNIATFIFYLVTGTYIFNILYLFGVPAIFIIPITVIYFILLGRSIIALIRGV
jgi:hypothetical protein